MSVLRFGTGPLALCVHGFPDTAYTWRHLAPTLVGAGYEVVAPFTRGYHPTPVPTDADYRIARLSDDVNELHRVFAGDEKAVLVGHDWGAETAYRAAEAEPARWSKLVTISVPPPGLDAVLLADPGQRDRLAYAVELQEADAEQASALLDRAFVTALWRRWSPGYDATSDVELALTAWPSSVHRVAAASYYRDNRLDLGVPAPDDGPRVACPQPTLYLHGEKDGCIQGDLVRDVTAYLAPGSDAVMIEDAGHFLHLERPEVVNPLITNFLAGS